MVNPGAFASASPKFTELTTSRLGDSQVIDPHQLFGAIVALNALFASLAWCLARPNWASMISVLIFATIWPLVDKPLGGPVVHVIDETNGITTGDFISVFAGLVVAFQAWRMFRGSGKS